jgi:hypothetical protein
MKMIFYNKTPLAGMPYRTMKVCGRFIGSDGWARSIVESDGYGTRKFPVDVLAHEPRAAELIKEADVIIGSPYFDIEEFPYETSAKFFRHYSTTTDHWLNKNPSPEDSTVSAQKWYGYAKHLDVLPACIPIDTGMWKPGNKSPSKIVIAYTPSSTGSFKTESSKGWPQTNAILGSIKRKFKTGVEIRVVTKSPYLLSMIAKQKAHICIDECVTGSYHSAALEGMATGCATIAYLDDCTKEALRKVFNGNDEAYNSFPVISTQIGELEDRLEELIRNKESLRQKGMETREWMQKNYSEQWQAEKWINWHRNSLQKCETAS